MILIPHLAIKPKRLPSELPDRCIGAVSQPMYERAVKLGWISGHYNNE
jgi:hypothetical protein